MAIRMEKPWIELTPEAVKALLRLAFRAPEVHRVEIRCDPRNRASERVIRKALERNPPPLHQNQRAKAFYAAQVGSQPPTIVLFCNDPAAFSEQYRRYLLGALREQMPFSEVPIKLYLRRRSRGDQRDEIEPDRSPAKEGNRED